jgi:hypothetical protein
MEKAISTGFGSVSKRTTKNTCCFSSLDFKVRCVESNMAHQFLAVLEQQIKSAAEQGLFWVAFLI